MIAACAPLAAEQVEVAEALGRVLAEDVLAGYDVPPFRSSAMDGYAVTAGEPGRTLAVAGESRAGAPADRALGPGEAFRISTGAAVPDGADAVLQQELTELHGDEVTLLDAVAAGRNVREPGEDMRAGETALASGARLGPAELGVAVNAGRAELDCARRPRAAVLATGDELLPPGSELGAGQIHDSNLVTLSALAARDGADVTLARHVPDDAAGTRAALGAALEAADVVLLSGGVSVGPHDHVKGALAELGVEERFWRVALRPGKPTWFGCAARRSCSGCPATRSRRWSPSCSSHDRRSPASRAQTPRLPAVALLGEPLTPNAARDECVRVRLQDGRVWSTGPQGSHVLRSMTLADALAFVPQGEEVRPAGTEVELIAI